MRGVKKEHSPLVTPLFVLPIDQTYPEITFWQALGLLALCRILFGGFGGGGHRSHSGRRMKERMGERRDARWEEMTPEERERLRQRIYDRGGQTTPLDSNAGG